MMPVAAAAHAAYNNPFPPAWQQQQQQSPAYGISAHYASSPGSSPTSANYPGQWAERASTSSPHTAGALVLYNPSSLWGLYYNEQLHGPFATGQGSNPFVPGLSHHASAAPKLSYATPDPVAEKYPAARAAADPLNWITEELFHVSEQRARVNQQRAPLRASA